MGRSHGRPASSGDESPPKQPARIAREANYLRRIDEVDRSGPAINSIIELNPERAGHRSRTRQGTQGKRPARPAARNSGLIKDNIGTHDRMMTTAGFAGVARLDFATRCFRGAKASGSGLRSCLGKTNLSEWANFRSTRSTSGRERRGGLTKNPYALDPAIRPAQAPAQGRQSRQISAAVGIGTETDGSITSPCSSTVWSE